MAAGYCSLICNRSSATVRLQYGIAVYVRIVMVVKIQLKIECSTIFIRNR